MLKKIIFKILIISICLQLISSSIQPVGAQNQQNSSDVIRVCILHNGSSNSWTSTYQFFKQTLVANASVEQIEIKDGQTSLDLSSYDFIYPDPSIVNSKNSQQLKYQLMSFVYGGGTIFLENSLYNWLPKKVVGAKDFKEVPSFPDKINYPTVNGDLQNIQNVIKDFEISYRQFSAFKDLKAKSYGMGIIPDTATTIANDGNTSLYTVNKYGKGFVFFTSALLPNKWYISGFDMKKENSDQLYFNNTVSSATSLLLDEGLVFASKQKYGYSLKKVLGPYGRPAMAYQNHFEVLSAVKEQSMEKWFSLTKKYNLIPSFSLSRGMYEWSDRYESVGYQLNSTTGSGIVISHDNYNSLYAPGEHAIVNDSWLNLAKSPIQDTYFNEMNISHRAYPYATDINNDGLLDLICGSSDGKFYYYQCISLKDGWQLKKIGPLKDANGLELKVNTYSAPILYDIDKDKIADLVSGCLDGNIYWFKGLKNNTYKPMGILVNAPVGEKLSAPEISDYNADGSIELVVGTMSGNIYYAKGSLVSGKIKFGKLSKLKNSSGKDIHEGKNAAPRLFDDNNDGYPELYVGTADGYIVKYKNNKGHFSYSGYIDNIYSNDRGNEHFKYGNNVVPFFADINKDGKKDLITGRLEFGTFAVPIDSKYFPYRDELLSAIEFCNENGISIEPHVFTHKYKDSPDEKTELALHKAAFQSYGLGWDGLGTNQHTWKINFQDGLQTILNEYDSGLRWNSGFTPANSPVDPSGGTEYTWARPYYLADGLNTTSMLLFNASLNLTATNRKGYDDLMNSIYRWDMPVSVYLHIEYNMYKNPKSAESSASVIDSLRNKWDYNFMTETQYAMTMMAVLDNTINANSTVSDGKLHVSVEQNAPKDNNNIFNNTLGLKLELADKYKGASFTTDADIYQKSKDALYFGVNKPISISTGTGKTDNMHIMRVNLPVEISKSDDILSIDILDKGLQQLKIYAPQGIKLAGPSKEWNIEYIGSNIYVLTRYGGEATLDIYR